MNSSKDMDTAQLGAQLKSPSKNSHPRDESMTLLLALTQSEIRSLMPATACKRCIALHCMFNQLVAANADAARSLLSRGWKSTLQGGEPARTIPSRRAGTGPQSKPAPQGRKARSVQEIWYKEYMNKYIQQQHDLQRLHALHRMLLHKAPLAYSGQPWPMAFSHLSRAWR